MDETTAKVTSIRFVNNNQLNLLCLTGDTEVLLSNRMDLKMIKDIRDGDSVTTVDPSNLHEEPSRIFNKFGRMSEKLLEIRTISGRTIKATPEHPFLVNNNGKPEWKNAGDLTMDDKLIIRHTEKMIIPEKETIVTINEIDVLANYRMELLEAGYLAGPITQERLVCLARLIGAINTDGHLGESVSKENGNNYYHAEFNVGEEIDAFDLADDISKIGFGNPSVKRYTSKFVDKTNGRESTYNTWRVIKDGVFAYLLSLLGGFVGRKTGMSREIPNWLINSNKLIKREFLSAFQGGDGCKITYQSNANINTYCIAMNRTSQTTIDMHEEVTSNYMKQISKLLAEFDIITKVEVKKSKNEGKKVVELIFQQTAENLVKYANIIGYRYCEEKRRKTAPVIEHLKIRECLQNERNEKYKIMFDLLKNNNNSDKFIADKCDLSIKQVNKIRNKLKKGISPTPRFTCSNIYDTFVKDNIMNNGNVSIGIKKITVVPNEMVYDFTTQFNNHSFLASSIWSHNCPSETPEGAKIGIVKSLSMMSGISVQNSSQADVVRGLLKLNKNIKHPYDIDPLTMNGMVKIFINGDWNGVCKISEATSVYDTLKKSRRDGVIDKMTSILFDYRSKEIRVYYDGGRLIRPVLIVSNNKLNFTPESIKDIEDEYNLNDKTKSWKKILSKYPNLVEYEDIESFNYAMVAMNEEKLEESITASKRVVEYKESTKINRYGDYRFVKYTHCDFSSWIMLGAIVGNIPFCDHNYATRNIIHFSQAKQAIGIYMSSYNDRMDISQILYHPQLPLVTTQAMKYNNCMDLPYGENAIVAICSYTGLTVIAQVVM
jgi:intein/homing endonuclease